MATTDPWSSSAYIRVARMSGAVVSAPVIGTVQAGTRLDTDVASMGDCPASRVLL
jgi:flagellar basal body P-ring protein FlgI